MDMFDYTRRAVGGGQNRPQQQQQQQQQQYNNYYNQQQQQHNNYNYNNYNYNNNNNYHPQNIVQPQYYQQQPQQHNQQQQHINHHYGNRSSPSQNEFQKKGISPPGPIYNKKGVLGQGSFGQVLLVQDNNTNEYYALKFINVENYKTATKYIDGEVETLQLLQNDKHPFLVNLVDQLDSTTLLMEYCNGGTLDIYHSSTFMDEEHEKVILSQLLAGLEYLVKKLIIHRDIKPQNVLVKKSNGKVIYKISDFGFAKLHDELDAIRSRVGTPLYMAPEMDRGNYTSSVDIYALGITFCVLSNCPIGVNKKIDRTHIDRMCVTPEYKTLLKAMIHEDPTQRYTIQRILNDPWFKSRNISVDFFSSNLESGFKPLNLNLSDLYVLAQDNYEEIEKKYKVQLRDKFLFVEYLDSQELYPLERISYELKPIYTAEKIYCFDGSNVTLLQIPSTKSFNLSPTIINYDQLAGGDFQDTTELIRVEQNNIAKIEDLIVALNLVIKRSFQTIQIYQALKAFYLEKCKTPEFKKTIDKLKLYTERYKPNMSLFEQMKELKNIDRFGNETNELLIDVLPQFVKGFLNNDMTSLYNDIESTSTVFSKSSKFIDDFSKILNQSRKTLDTIIQHVSKLKTLLITNLKLEDPQSSYCPIFDSEQLLKDSRDTVESIVKIYEPLLSVVNPELVHLNLYMIHILKMLKSVDSMLNIPHVLFESDDLMKDISRIPNYYKNYCQEVKRRAKFNQTFINHREKLAMDLHTLIRAERSNRESFDTADRPKYFGLEYTDTPLENPMARYVPTGDTLSFNDLMVNEGFVYVAENDIISQITSDKLDLIKRIEVLKNENTSLKSVIQSNHQESYINNGLNNSVSGSVINLTQQNHPSQPSPPSSNINNNNNNNESLQKELQLLKEKVKILTSQLQSSKETRESELVQNEKVQQELSTENEQLRTTIVEHHNQWTVLVEKIKEEHIDLQEKYTELERERDELLQEKSQLESEKENLSDLLGSTIETHEKQVNDRNRNELKSKELIKTEFDRLKTQNTALAAKSKAQEEEIDSLNEIIKMLQEQNPPNQ